MCYTRRVLLPNRTPTEADITGHIEVMLESPQSRKQRNIMRDVSRLWDTRGTPDKTRWLRDCQGLVDKVYKRKLDMAWSLGMSEGGDVVKTLEAMQTWAAQAS